MEPEDYLSIIFDTATLFTLLLFVVGGFVFYELFWKPFDWFRDFSDLGFESTKKSDYSDQTRKNVINELRQRRKVGDLPPVYPNGWFVALESDELPRKTAKEVSVLGLNLVAWRGESGKSYLADAYCPHLGAHLGVGGQVNGECVTCPFHGWEFGGEDGCLKNIPYSDTVMDFAKIKLWESVERNGFIYIWHHAEGESPNWSPDLFPHIESGHWRYRGRSEFRVACHIQEIPENGPDVNHLNIVHKDAMMAGGSPDMAYLKWGIFTHQWNASWTPSTEKAHEAILRVKHNMCFLNHFPFLHMDVEVKQVGPGIVQLEFNTVLGKGILFHMVTPLEPLLQRVTHRFYSEPTFVHPYGKLILLGEAIMIERDIKIWNRKTYMNRPILSKEDRQIKAFRKWYTQFYSENSPRFSFSANRDSNANKLKF